MAFRFPDSLKRVCNHPVTPPGDGARLPPAAHRGAVRDGPNRWPLISVAKPVAESTPSALQDGGSEPITRPSRAGRSLRLRQVRRSPPDDWSSRSPRPTRPRAWGVSRPQAWELSLGHCHACLIRRRWPCLHLVSTLSEWGQQLLVVSSTPSDLRFCSPNGIRTRVATLRGWSGPPPESAAIRRSPGQGVVVPAGVRSNRWVPRGFSSNASSRPDAPSGARMRVDKGRGHAQARDLPAAVARVQLRACRSELANAQARVT